MFEDFPLFPERASTIAGQVDALFITLIAISALITLAIVVTLIIFAIRFRRRSETESPKPIEGSLLLELTWTIKHVRGHGIAKFSGRLVGRPFPPRGVTVDLQIFQPGVGWRVFANARTRKSGSFTVRYHFQRASQDVSPSGSAALQRRLSVLARCKSTDARARGLGTLISAGCVHGACRIVFCACGLCNV